MTSPSGHGDEASTTAASGPGSTIRRTRRFSARPGRWSATACLVRLLERHDGEQGAVGDPAAAPDRVHRGADFSASAGQCGWAGLVDGSATAIRTRSAGASPMSNPRSGVSCPSLRPGHHSRAAGTESPAMTDASWRCRSDMARLGRLPRSDPMIRITVDRDRCIGSGNCVFWAPGTFELDDEGLRCRSNRPVTTMECIRVAADGCPTRAITIRWPTSRRADAAERLGRHVEPERESCADRPHRGARGAATVGPPVAGRPLPARRGPGAARRRGRGSCSRCGRRWPHEGWLGIHLPEDIGGQGFGLSSLAVILEETGWALVPGPLLPTVVVSALCSPRCLPGGRPAARLLWGLADGSDAGGGLPG